MNQTIFNSFVNTAHRLNKDFHITPLLYGSLGLEILTGIEFSPEDIDVLIPEVFLTSQWDEFKEKMESYGYQLINLEEHEFVKVNYRIAFASFEELREFAGIDLEAIEIVNHEGTCYKLLNLEQYLKVYKRSSMDGYRKTKKNDKDTNKIHLIETLLKK
ncbi:hypothetical protein M3650_03755 [Paenibacillus sp. MER TA 81-3]|uniref:hypothetical protein n=1 Tax=Paenibacillus sp. MER TA 81-3 TaxID=2939573 RepID=UPI00203E2E83|nr:hypothetical protein [Paenibacillus sp. MER TA 81-3]MCM3337772.1 hypothetical protein [Paenibacillus sp. MER TA 81-3]